MLGNNSIAYIFGNSVQWSDLFALASRQDSPNRNRVFSWSANCIAC